MNLGKLMALAIGLVSGPAFAEVGIPLGKNEAPDTVIARIVLDIFSRRISQTLNSSTLRNEDRLYIAQEGGLLLHELGALERGNETAPNWQFLMLPEQVGAALTQSTTLTEAQWAEIERLLYRDLVGTNRELAKVREPFSVNRPGALELANALSQRGDLIRIDDQFKWTDRVTARMREHRHWPDHDDPFKVEGRRWHPGHRYSSMPVALRNHFREIAARHGRDALIRELPKYLAGTSWKTHPANKDRKYYPITASETVYIVDQVLR